MSDKKSYAIKLLQKKNYKKALPVLQKINKDSNVRVFESLRLEAVCLTFLSKFSFSLKKWESLLDIAKNSREKVAALHGKAHALHMSGSNKKAVGILVKALKLTDASNDIDSRVLLCNICKEIEEFDLIEKNAPALLNTESTSINAQLLLIGSAKAATNKPLILKRINELLTYSHKLDLIQIFHAISTLLELNENKLACETFQLLPRPSVDIALYSYLEAMIALVNKDYPRVISLLQESVISELPDWKDSINAMKILGQAYEKSKQYEESFNCILNMGRYKELTYKSFKKYDYIKDYAKIDITKLSTLPYESTSELPVFMLGFPRSGTTLLETILDTQEKIATLSEVDTIDGVHKHITEMTGNTHFPLELPNLSDEQLYDLRQIYFNKVAEYLSDNDRKKLVIDKMPIRIIHIPLINMIFPKAKYILNLRHPLDVCISNAQQSYKLNNEMAFLLSLENCVSRYDQVWTFFDEVEKKLELNTCTIRYEDIVKDIDGECEKLFSFLGIEKAEDINDFHQHARSKVITTPSQNQVSLPLYKSSSHKWKNYQPMIDPFIPQLESHILKYGYKV